jgi:hypothetical protein
MMCVRSDEPTVVKLSRRYIMADSKRSQAIAIMNDNADKAMSQVVEMIADAINVTIPNAKSYYRYIVKHKLAAGNAEVSARGGSKAKAQKAPAPKAEAKPVKVKAEPKAKAPAKPKAPAKAKTAKAKDEDSARSAEDSSQSPKDIEAIKAANLKRMKEVTAKMKAKGLQPGQYANPESVGVPEGFTPEKARAEVAQMYKDLESFEMPKFLTKDAVKALV